MEVVAVELTYELQRDASHGEWYLGATPQHILEDIPVIDTTFQSILEQHANVRHADVQS